jgi:hypothetical protein
MRHAAKIAALTVAIVLVPAAVAGAAKTASPTSLRFPHTKVDTVSAPLTITYSITADETNRTTDVLVDCNAAQFQTCSFRTTSTCPAAPLNFPAGAQSCTIQVFFQPRFAGGHSQNVIISTDSAAKVAVSGVGTAAPSKGKKCGKKKKGKKGASAAAKKKKCGKKKG